MGVEPFVSFARAVLLASSISAVCVFCTGAAIRRSEGAAGAAVRIMLTLIAPATALAFAGIFVWPLALGASVLVAIVQGGVATGALIDRVWTIWGSLSIATKMAGFTFLVVVAFKCGFEIASPPLDGDSLLYHLPVTAALLQDRSMWFTRAVMFPGASEIADALAGATVGSVNGRAIIGLAELLVLLMAAYGWARRAGASHDGAAAAAIIAGSLPITVEQMFRSLNDLLVCALVACACVLWRLSPRLAALSLGLVFATKVTALFLVPAVGVVMLAFEGWPFSIADLGWAAALAAPWYIRTIVMTGHPVLPMASLGWASTIAKNFARAGSLSLLAIRHYGGQTMIGGLVSAIYIALSRGRPTFARAIPWLALATYVAWILMPNAAEAIPGKLDQVGEGWSIRYAMLLPFILATALPIALDVFQKLPLAGLIAVGAAASAIVRSGKASATDDPLSIPFALWVAFAVLCVIFAIGLRSRAARTGFLAAALIMWSWASVIGAESVRQQWGAAYVQWTQLLPPSIVASDPRISRYHKAGVVGMRSFPLVGPDFKRRVYEDIIFTPDLWLERLRANGVGLLVAAGNSGSPAQRRFLQPTDLELEIARSRDVCLMGQDGYVRLYALNAVRGDPRCKESP